MKLGQVITIKNGPYDIRGAVDGRCVVRIRNRVTGEERYRFWTEDERAKFDLDQDMSSDRDERNNQIYERRLADETYKSLAREFGLTSTEVTQVCARQLRKEKIGSRS